MDYSILTDEELLRFAYNEAVTPLENELVKRLEKAVEQVKDRRTPRPRVTVSYPRY